MSEVSQSFEVAIIGGGIVGLALATGLVHRGVQVKLYEKTSSFRPIGAGIGFTPNTKQALELLHPGALAAEQKVATANGDPDNPNDWLRYLDGFHHTTDEADEETLLYELYTGYRGFEGCVRADFLDELLKLIPDGVIEFGKSIHNILDLEDERRVLLQFEDGSVAEADAVIGCDGIKSRVRMMMFPATEPSYNHQYALRGVIPMDKAIEALGEYKARNRHMHLGPDRHVVTVPIALGKALNVVAFIPDAEQWPSSTAQLTAPADPAVVLDAFKDFGRPVRNLMQTLVDLTPQLTKWGIFDSVDHPAPSFTKGRICIAGDAAHASSPHHGAGAGMGIEDALVLSTLLAEVAGGTFASSKSRAEAVCAAFQAYTTTRKERSQWVAESSRVIGQIFEWRYPPTMRNWDKCLEELTVRSHRIWHFDQEAMLRAARAEYETLLGRTQLEQAEDTRAILDTEIS
ncbi:hypothetical protein CDV55_100828 [Aspergillus turcosus]|nr:hypothetical protein CDV55_100828 [Aspergillus turcosus]